MIALFKRSPHPAPADTGALGESVLAMVVAPASTLAPGCTAVLIDPAGQARRPGGTTVAAGPGESAWQFHPGPYRCTLRPFAAAAELGLHLVFVIDSADPRLPQQRFDLYLASEAQGGVLRCAPFCAAIEAALQGELAEGQLALPPCTALAEWQAFRAGLDRLLYQRFGVTVEECLPVDLGDQVDFAALLAARAAASDDLGEDPAEAPAGAAARAQVQPAEPPAAQSHAGAPEAHDHADGDAKALRRLFLELPCLLAALRRLSLPPGPALFARQQALLRQFDLLSLQLATMPALRLAAPGRPLDGASQARRAGHARRACTTLDQAWALLARLPAAPPAAAAEAWLDEAERIAANLACDLDGRRATDGAAP